MSKPQDEQRFYTPAPYSRGEGVRRVYHPKRGNHPRKVLAAEGEVVTVRPAETGYWRRLEMSGDVIRGELPSAPARTKSEKGKG